MTPLLDYGYIKFVEGWGSDERIVEAARMSVDKGFKGWGDAENPGDERLLKHLYENNHATPFEMAGCIIEVKAPIMVYREWHRHRTQCYNEMSGRYVPLPNEDYLPSVERLMINAGQAVSNTQAGTIRGSEVLTVEAVEKFREALKEVYHTNQLLYETALNSGIPKELARVHLPVARYSRMRAGASLRNWIGFLTLRQDPKAQWEIRQYANALGDILQEQFPRTYQLYLNNRKF